MSLTGLVWVVALVSQVQDSGAEPPAAAAVALPELGPEERYLPSRVSIPRPGPDRKERGARVAADPLLQLRRYGRMESFQAGETLELAALRLGLDPAQLALRNDFTEVEGAPPYFCTSFGHRLLPDEDLDFVAAAYGCEQDALRALNGLAEGEQPEAWTKVQVPFRWRVTPQQVELRVPVPLWSRIRGEAQLVFKHRDLRHEVLPEDTWSSLADRYDSTEEILQSVNRPMRGALQRLPRGREEGAQAAVDLSEMESAHVGTILELEQPRLDVLVLYLEGFLGVDADRVCRLNGLQELSQLAEQDELRLPFAFPGGFATLSFARSTTSVSGGPGVNVHLAVRSEDGVRVFDLGLQ